MQEIQLLTVRERRMMKRIDTLKDMELTIVKVKKSAEKDKRSVFSEEEGTLGQIQSIENALTRVQAQKQRAIDAIHRFGFDDAKLQLELMKVELTMLKDNKQTDEIADDGFMSAMNDEAATVWGDADD